MEGLVRGPWTLPVVALSQPTGHTLVLHLHTLLGEQQRRVAATVPSLYVTIVLNYILDFDIYLFYALVS